MGGQGNAKALEGEIYAQRRVPWRCRCGKHTLSMPFVFPKGWVLQRDEEGTGLIPTMKEERVLCPDCAQRQRAAL